MLKKASFEIVNELLNQGWIVEDVQPSLIEALVLKILQREFPASLAGKKVHFLDTDAWEKNSLCRALTKKSMDLLFTEVEDDVTCKRCQISLKKQRP